MFWDDPRLAQQIRDGVAEADLDGDINLELFMRSLTDQDLREFCDELESGSNAREIIAGWRATARIRADEGQYANALRATEGDFGCVRLP